MAQLLMALIKVEPVLLISAMTPSSTSGTLPLALKEAPSTRNMLPSVKPSTGCISATTESSVMIVCECKSLLQHVSKSGKLEPAVASLRARALQYLLQAKFSSASQNRHHSLSQQQSPSVTSPLATLDKQSKHIPDMWGTRGFIGPSLAVDHLIWNGTIISWMPVSVPDTSISLTQR